MAERGEVGRGKQGREKKKERKGEEAGWSTRQTCLSVNDSSECTA